MKTTTTFPTGTFSVDIQYSNYDSNVCDCNGEYLEIPAEQRAIVMGIPNPYIIQYYNEGDTLYEAHAHIEVDSTWSKDDFEEITTMFIQDVTAMYFSYDIEPINVETIAETIYDWETAMDNPEYPNQDNTEKNFLKNLYNL